MTLYFVQCVKKGEDSMANPGAKNNGTVVEYVFMFLENISTFLKKVSMF